MLSFLVFVEGFVQNLFGTWRKVCSVPRRIFNQRGHREPNHHGVLPYVADGKGWRCIKFYYDGRTILPADVGQIRTILSLLAYAQCTLAVIFDFELGPKKVVSISL
jgi:hypothetical protein